MRSTFESVTANTLNVLGKIFDKVRLIQWVLGCPLNKSSCPVDKKKTEEKQGMALSPVHWPAA